MANINDIVFKIYFSMNKPREYAGLLLRFLAFFVDFIIISILGNLILLFINNDFTRYIDDFNPIFFLSNPIIIIISWLYFSILESNANFQATLGKKIFKLKVVNIHDKKITFGQASGRFFGKIISGFILGIGFFMIGFTKYNQGLHDIAAGTFVKINYE